jgi:hypothetical protein
MGGLCSCFGVSREARRSAMLTSRLERAAVEARDNAEVALLLLGALPTRVLARARAWMGKAGLGAGPVLGGGLVLVGALVVTGVDKRLETWLVDAAPAWLTRLSVAL